MLVALCDLELLTDVGLGLSLKCHMGAVVSSRRSHARAWCGKDGRRFAFETLRLSMRKRIKR